MALTGAVRFPGSLDPSAQEFRPGFTNTVEATQIPFVCPLPLFYPYAPPAMPFFDGPVGFGPQYYDPVRTVPQPPYVAMAPQPAPPLRTAGATRVLVLSSVAPDVTETTVRRELEVFGEVRGVQMERVREGIVTVHFYDLRAAEWALRELREQHMQQQNRLRNFFAAALTVGDCSSADGSAYPPLPAAARGLVGGRAVWAHFIVPASNAVPDGNNQGSIVVFNLDSGVSSAALKDIFQQFGPVKELRETPFKKQQRFVEFYDVRDAAKALGEINGREINGRQIVIEFSRPGGYSKRFYNYANNAAAAIIKSLPPVNDYSRNGKFVPPSPPPPLAPKFPGRFKPNNIPPRVFLSHNEPFARKPWTNCGKTNPNGSCSGRSSLDVEASSPSSGCTRKNGKMSEGSASNKKAQPPKNRAWKGNRQTKKYDARFLISEEAMNEPSCRDSRTTVMIKNIPNKYSQKLLLNMLDNHCIHCNEQIDEGDGQPLSSYDFVYLPIDFNNKCNVGYGFVNMTSPEATWRLYKAFHHQHWEVFNSRKICEVTYARVQGLEALKEHFRNSKFPSEMEHYLPVVFSPPRDGKQLTDPQPVCGRLQGSSSVSTAPSSPQGTVEEAWEGGDEDYMIVG